jgi:DNA mismatch repair ATPase MutS
VTEKGDQGSLFWLLKATHTAFGARLLRHWVRHDSPARCPCRRLVVSLCSLLR